MFGDRLCNQSSGSEKKIILCIVCFAHTLLLLLLLLIVLLNCLYLSPLASPFVYPPAHLIAGEEEG